MDSILSFYKFVHLDDLTTLRSNLLNLSQELSLKGTILIAPEGINGNVAGSPENTERFEAWMAADPRFTDIEYKRSNFDGVSYRRMLVKIKKEIITMKVQGLDPEKETGAFLEPDELRKWYAQGREMVVVDTRNDYEVAMGTFKGAIDPKIKKFSDFPKWVDENLQDVKDKCIVTFCTGGIRCEKATAYMLKKGFKEVYQIKGGILKYLEAYPGQSDWQGECIVFDKRKALATSLESSSKDICFVCLAGLDENNHSKVQHPAGLTCVTCEESLRHHHELRQKRGLIKQQENLARRKAARSPA